MFIGHFAVGLAAKKFAPRASLGVLLTAPILLDLLWPIFLMLGWEQVRIDPGNTRFTPLEFTYYPYSHSLVMAVLWASLFSAIYYLFSRYRLGMIAIWVGVVSHWVLDAIVHRPDLPIYPDGGPKIGLGLWNHVAATVCIESAMFVAGLWLYMSVTRPRDGIGRYLFWAFIFVLAFIYAGVITQEPPPNIGAIIGAGLVSWIVVPWVATFDKHRDLTVFLSR